MKSIVASRIVGGNSAYKRVDSDFYPTPEEATIALLDFLSLPSETVVWEPACGEGHMVRVLQKYGLKVIGTDIHSGTDYLTTEDFLCDWIITNPPFSLADEFIERSIRAKKTFAMLLKAQFWHAKKRLSLFFDYPPTYILPLTWRPDFTFHQRGKGSPLMDVMWVVWCGSHETKYIPLVKPKETKRG